MSAQSSVPTASIGASADGRLSRAEEFVDIETPAYVLDPETAIDDYRDLKEALGTALIVSLKANANPDLLVRAGHAFVDGVEVASIGELNVVVGRLDKPKYVSTPAADDRLILACSASRGIFVADSPAQVQRVVGLKPRLRNPLPVVVRLNAAAVLGNALAAGRRDHFGMSVADAAAALRALADAEIEIRGLHVFAGSQSFRQAGTALAHALPPVIEVLESSCGTRLAFVNLGGGFGEDWREAGRELAAYRRAIAPLAEGRTLAHEAGRAVFSRCGSFAVRVVATKHLDGAVVAICDGGFAHAFRLAQTESFVRRRQAPRLLRPGGAATVGPIARVLFVGNSCSPADLIGEADMTMPRPGDVVLFDRCGAYASYSPSGFLNLKPAQRYLVS